MKNNNEGLQTTKNNTQLINEWKFILDNRINQFEKCIIPLLI